MGVGSGESGSVESDPEVRKLKVNIRNRIPLAALIWKNQSYKRYFLVNINNIDSYGYYVIFNWI